MEKHKKYNPDNGHLVFKEGSHISYFKSKAENVTLSEKVTSKAEAGRKPGLLCQLAKLGMPRKSS